MFIFILALILILPFVVKMFRKYPRGTFLAFMLVLFSVFMVNEVRENAGNNLLSSGDDDNCDWF